MFLSQTIVHNNETNAYFPKRNTTTQQLIP